MHLFTVDYTVVQWLRFWTVTQMGVGSRPGRRHLFVKKYLALYLVVALMVPSAPSVVSMNSNLSWWSASLAARKGCSVARSGGLTQARR